MGSPASPSFANGSNSTIIPIVGALGNTLTTLNLAQPFITGAGSGITINGDTMTIPAGTYYVEIGVQIVSDSDLTVGNLSTPSMQFYLADTASNPNGYVGPWKAVAAPNFAGRTAFERPTGLTAAGMVIFGSTKSCNVKGFVTGFQPPQLAPIGLSTICITKIT